MILEFRQLNKELFTADFAVMHNTLQEGAASLKGKISSREGIWNVSYGGNVYSMSAGSMNLPKGLKATRPYDISVGGNPLGTVFQSAGKGESIFSTYTMLNMILGNDAFTLYEIGFGNDGAKNPLYFNGVQIAEIRKPAVVHDELHHFQIYISDPNYAAICILLCCYSYVLSFFSPGEKVTSSVRKITHTSKCRDLLAKYNPDFINSVLP